MSEKFPDGWFRDPENPDQLRYWDGAMWTDQRMDAPAYAQVTEPTGANFNAKRFLVPAAIGAVALITVVAIVASGVNSGENEEPRAAEQTPGASAAPADGTGDADADAGGEDAAGGAGPIAVGESVEVGGTEYTVISAEQVSDGYVAVEIEVVNLQPEGTTFPERAATLIGADDQRYESTGDAAIAAGYDDSLLFNPIQPDSTNSGVLVFDVPTDAVEGATLELADLFSADTAVVDLGL